MKTYSELVLEMRSKAGAEAWADKVYQTRMQTALTSVSNSVVKMENERTKLHTKKYVDLQRKLNYYLGFTDDPKSTEKDDEIHARRDWLIANPDKSGKDYTLWKIRNK